MDIEFEARLCEEVCLYSPSLKQHKDSQMCNNSRRETAQSLRQRRKCKSATARVWNRSAMWTQAHTFSSMNTSSPHPCCPQLSTSKLEYNQGLSLSLAAPPCHNSAGTTAVAACKGQNEQERWGHQGQCQMQCCRMGQKSPMVQRVQNLSRWMSRSLIKKCQKNCKEM